MERVPIPKRTIVAAAIVGATLPTAIPGYAFALEQLEAPDPWSTTMLVELALAACGASIGAIAAATHRRGPLAFLPLLPLAAQVFVAIRAAGAIEERVLAMHGVGPGPMLAWIIGVAGGAVGILLQVAIGFAVWGIAKLIASHAENKDAGALGAHLAAGSAILHVMFKAIFTPVLLGVLGCVIAAVLALRAKRVPTLVLCVLAAGIGLASETVWSWVREDAAHQASLPPCVDAPWESPPVVGEYTRVLLADPGVERAGSSSDPEQRGAGMVYAQHAWVVPRAGTTADAAWLAGLTARLRAIECASNQQAEPVDVVIGPPEGS